MRFRRENCGIYIIRNIINGKVYVGSSDAIVSRWCRHRSFLRWGQHTNTKLQRAWLKYGEESFSFELVLCCAKDSLFDYEQRFIDSCNAVASGYNIAPCAGGARGYKHTPEARANMSRAQRGKTFSEEAKEKMRRSQTGKKQTPEQIAKRIASTRARGKRVLSEQAKEQLVQRNKNMVFTPEIREKMAAAKRGKKRSPHSAEVRQRISESNKRTKASQRVAA